MSYPKIKDMLKSIESIEHNNCPVCASKLFFDNQKDSVYVSCHDNFRHFEVAAFKDLGSGNFVLLYNNDTEGIVNNSVLGEFQKTIYRKIYNR